MYFLEQGQTEKFIIEQCVQQGLPLPERIQNAPELEIGLELYYVGFLDLINSRQTGFGEGPIEWLTIHNYCQAQGVEGEQRQDFFYHIRQMDSAYLKFKSKKNKPGKPAKGAKKSGSST